MLTREEIEKYTKQECEKLTYFEIVDWLINEIHNHEITKQTLSLTLDKLEASRKVVKRLRNKEGK